MINVLIFQYTIKYVRTYLRMIGIIHDNFLWTIIVKKKAYLHLINYNLRTINTHLIIGHKVVMVYEYI